MSSQSDLVDFPVRPRARRAADDAGRAPTMNHGVLEDRGPLVRPFGGRLTVNIANLNLNLLTALDALLRERSVTNAAAKLGLSQPALSASLARLRRHFNDPLLVRVEFHPHTPQLIERAEEVLREADAMILPRGFASGLPHLDLFTDTWVCLVDVDHPTIGETATLADLASNPWVVSYRSSSAFTPPMRQMENLGVDVHVQIVVESFLAIPQFVVGTDRIALVQERLVPMLQRGHSLRTVPCPFDVIPLVEALWWHPAQQLEPGHTWLRSIIREAARGVDQVQSSEQV